MGLFAALDPDSPAAGGKARSLARLAAGGHPTPAGFAVTDELFRALRQSGPALPRRLDEAALLALDGARAALDAAPFPPGFEAALGERLAALPAARFSVRSSFAHEDDPADVAAGVFESRTEVAPGDVARAIRAVLRSALAPGAVAYALSRGLEPAAPPVAVLVHGYVPGEAHGHAALDPAGAPIVTATTGQPSAGARALIEGALGALARQHGPVEVEWTATADAVTFLQLRPYRAAAPAPPWRGFASLSERGAWRWDAAHNPLPLSPAQAGLVALADEQCEIGLRQRVLGGYLFHTPGGSTPPPIRPEQVPAAFATLRARAEDGLAALGSTPALEDALALFLSIYEPLFGVIQPAARAGRRALEAFLREHLPAAVPHLPALLAGVESMARERGRRAGDPAAYLALFGDEAPVWDVAEPTYRERADLPSGPIRTATTTAAPPSSEPLAALAPSLRAEAERRLAVARACAAVGEDDDWLYARVQTAVRRAILALGRRLQRTGAVDRPDDLFFWPLPAVRAVGTSSTLPANPRALAETGRAEVEAARRDPPPAPRHPGAVLRGSGTSGRALGRVRRHDRARPFSSAAGTVLVADTLLPTELPLIDAAALVTETGGPLDHVAAQARDRGLPAVVGAAGAMALADGTLVLVDADQGLVVTL